MAKKGKLNLLGVSAFCESMASMLGAGIDASEAVSLLKQKEGEHGPLDMSIESMIADLDAGNTLHTAMRNTGIFPEYALSMVEAGEKTGRTDDVLVSLADYYAKQYTIYEKIRSVIMYPLAMIIMIMVVLYIMIKAVLPSFSDVYETLTGSISASSYDYISYAYSFCRVAMVLMAIIVVAVAVGYLLYQGKGKKAVERFLAHDRNCSIIMNNLAMYRFTSAYEVYLSSGMMADEALVNAREMTDYEPVEKQLAVCEEIMAQGNGFAKAANEAQLYEPVYARMLIPAEKSGKMEATLKRLTGLLSENVLKHTDILVNILEAILSGVLMVTIGIALLSVMLPLIGIMNSIG